MTTQQPTKKQQATKKQEGAKKHKYEVNKAKLEQLKKAAKLVRTGGKGTPRRKQKRVRRTPVQENAKLQQTLRKMNVNTIPDVDEVNFFMEDKSILHFSKPRVQAAVQSNTYIVTGKPEKKTFQEMLPSILSQLGTQDLSQLKNLIPESTKEDEGIPDLESFETKPEEKKEETKEEKTEEKKEETTEEKKEQTEEKKEETTEEKKEQTEEKKEETKTE